MKPNLDKLLLYTNDLTPEATEKVFTLTTALKAKIFALYVIDEGIIRKVMKEEKKEREVIKDEIEESAWEKLYELEETAFHQGVKISLLLLVGQASRVIREVMRSYEIDLLLIPRTAQLNIRKLIREDRESVLIIL